jgi:putative transposase
MENKNRTAYRTLVLRYDILKLPPEVASKILELLQVQEEFRQWANRWLKNPKTPKPVENPLKYFAVEFLYAIALKWLVGVKKNGVEVQRIKPPLTFSAQLRLNNEKDIGYGIFVDLPKRRIRIRKWSGRRGNTIVLPLGEDAVRWILERVREGGRLVLAAVWVGRSRRSHVVKLYVALVFRREITPIRPERLLVVDFNALHNGISWAVVEGGRMLKKGVLRPDISKILRLQKVVSKLDSLCAENDERCGEAVAVKSRIWRLLRAWEDGAVKELIWMARKRKAAIVVDVPDDESVRELKEDGYVSERKVFLNFGHIRRRLEGLAEWYGIPYREERLYSTICPHCGSKMEELPNRRVKCQCGFEAHRDETPFYWAVKLYPKLISFFDSPFSAALASSAAPAPQLCTYGNRLAGAIKVGPGLKGEGRATDPPPPATALWRPPARRSA